MGKKQKDNMLHILLKKENGKLTNAMSGGDIRYTDFVNLLEEGQVVDAFFDANTENKTLAQLAKAHKCVRLLAPEMGYSFEDLKLEIKKKAGLCVKKELEGEMYIICKSLSKCSVEELGLFIQACIEAGDLVNINLR